MSRLEFDFEPLNKVLDGKEITKDDAYEVFSYSKYNSEKIFKVASNLRDTHKGKAVSFSKKVFFNIVNLCRDTCSYCTYKAEIGESKLSMMNPDDVKNLAKSAAKLRCVEALLVTGESPEQKYDEASRWLGKNGFSSTGEYLAHCSELVLDEGLFPHTNAGNLNKSEMNDLKKTNVSMGLMLENSSHRLLEKGMPHHDAPSKDPKARIQILKNAGELKIPMTTGILVGIGENELEIIQFLQNLLTFENSQIEKINFFTVVDIVNLKDTDFSSVVNVLYEALKRMKKEKRYFLVLDNDLRMKMESDNKLYLELLNALEEDRITFAIQPIVKLDSLSPVGYEVLGRIITGEKVISIYPYITCPTVRDSIHQIELEKKNNRKGFDL